MPKPFTGLHMTLILVAFFGVVIGVNVFMAFKARDGFGGTVVENSYVASQKYNGWLKEARAQRALGWTVQASRRSDGHLVVAARGRDGRALTGDASAVLRHPLGRTADVRLVLEGAGPWTSAAPLPAGRWQLRLLLDVDGQREPFLVELP